jgi:2-haloacid dehalogenase
MTYLNYKKIGTYGMKSSERALTRRNVMGMAALGGAALSATAALAAQPRQKDQKMRAQGNRLPILVFDVNETLLDIDVLLPFFARLFGTPDRMREWFAQLILYSQSISLAGRYVPFGELAGGVIRMMGDIYNVPIENRDLSEMGRLIGSLPVHAEVPAAMGRLRDAGFRLTTLTNSAADPKADPLLSAGIADFFERRFTIEPVQRFKPAPETYAMVTHELGTAPADMCLIAAHTWDTVGAQAAGWKAALVSRPGNAPLRIATIPQPDLLGADIMRVADQIIARWG